MFTHHVFQNIKRALLFIFLQNIIHSWFAFKLFLFFKIAFAKSIQLPTLLFKDSSMCNDIEWAALVCLILAKTEAELLKQQLFNDFWQYLIIGSSLWYLKNFTHFECTIGTSKNSNVFVSCVLSWLWNFFLFKSGSRVLKFTSIQ